MPDEDVLGIGPSLTVPNHAEDRVVVVEFGVTGVSETGVVDRRDSVL